MSVLYTIAMSNAALAAYNTRLAALAVAGYDYFLTLPAEWRFYRAFYRSNFRLNTSLVLFVLIRYTSILAGTLGTWAYLSHGFTPESCRKFFLVPTLIRVLQCMISQAILGLRAYAISRKNRTVAIVLFSCFIFASAVEWLSSVYHRIPVLSNGSCGTGTLHPTFFLSTWMFYLVVMLYDLLTLSISMGYLFKYRPSSPFMSRLVKMMVYDGLGYFVALTLVNTINVILFRTHNSLIQSYAAPFGGVATWIMSQRILINLQGASADRLSTESPPYVHRSTHTRSAEDRSQSSREVYHIKQDGTEQVQVRVDRSVVVGVVPCNWKAAPCASDEPFCTPAVKWDEGSV
ncbi:hypothetical protein EDB92DRAFT_1884153 [Lactarius akahatsu]|uniref:DUF6533 domain-containing protein n=1 Tax=Lactarius akahatsu TaxID=416441 RepID=A0AAD4LD50_9AGAM|nr:hypothetical protein EDB92DRAFT_1884153 [Lactarius akahatsu]